MSLNFLQPLIDDKVDWNRFAYCLKHKYLPRRSGRTFARLSMMIRETLVTRDLETSYIYVSPNHQMNRMAYQDIYDVFNFIGIKPSLFESPFRIFVNDPFWPRPKARSNQLFFVSASDCSQHDLLRINCYGRHNVMVIHDWDLWTGSDMVLRDLNAMATKHKFS